MSDRIILSRLAIYAHHGMHPEEERLGQRFYVSLTCFLDLVPAGRADDWELSVCYAALAEMAHEIATTRRFQTIEGLGEAIAAQALARFSRIEAIRVTVEKPEAPVPFILDGVAVEIERRRDG